MFTINTHLNSLERTGCHISTFNMFGKLFVGVSYAFEEVDIT